MTPAEEAEMVEWIRARPPVIQELVRRFPPGAVVRATRPLLCPAPGETAWVYSYHEDGTINVLGTIGSAFYQQARATAVSEFAPGDLFQAGCAADDLEIVEYGPIDQSDVEAALSGDEASA